LWEEGAEVEEESKQFEASQRKASGVEYLGIAKGKA